MEGAYSFAAQPQAVQTSKAKGYRPSNSDWGSNRSAAEENGKNRFVNIMHDRRVVRGNTYSSQVLTENARTEAERLRSDQENENRRRQKQQRISKQQSNMPRSPAPVPGRKHADMQTEQYLEELSDRVIESEAETQTEAFMDKPAEPLFMPAVTGVDASTQVDVDELFDFDMEVQPVLEVLVGKTLEHAMMEVLEEEEIEAVRRHQFEFDQLRNTRLAEVQRLEVAELRRAEELERRMIQERERKEHEESVSQKVAARAFAKDYLKDLNASVFDKLLEAGHFYDPLVKEIQDVFLPWVDATATDHVKQVEVCRQVTDLVIAAALKRMYTSITTPVPVVVVPVSAPREEELAESAPEDADVAAETVDGSDGEAPEDA